MMRNHIFATLCYALTVCHPAIAQPQKEPPEPCPFEVLVDKDTGQLVELLSHRSALIREGVASWLHMLAAQGGIDFAPYAKKSLPAVIKALQRPEPKVQIYVAQFVGCLGPSAAPAVPALTVLLVDKNPDIRWASAVALKHLGLTAKQAIPALIKSLDDDNQNVRLHCAAALVALEKGGKRPLSMIIEALATEDCDYRSDVIFALGDLGLRAVPMLIDSLKAKKSKVRATAASALGATARTIRSKKEGVPREAIQALIKTLQDPDNSVVYAAVCGVSDFEEAAKEAVPEVIKCLKHPESSVRRIAAISLKYFGPHAEIAIPSLTEMLQDDDEFIRRAAAETIQALKMLKEK